jgi:predicted O-methyltransferase YrrM
MKKKSLATLLLISNLFYPLSCEAHWTHELLSQDSDLIYVNISENNEFLSLKEQIKDQLKNSWTSAEKVDLLMDLIFIIKPKKCVDIGSFTGSSILPVAKTLKYLNSGQVMAIEPFSNEICIKNLQEDNPNREWWKKVDMKICKETFENLLKSQNINSFVHLLQMSSETASHHLIDDIDFINIDGDFSEEGSLMDADLYLKKLKIGGYILLSNCLLSYDNKTPKMSAFSLLYDQCEYICDIENGNSVLFKKIN